MKIDYLNEIWKDIKGYEGLYQVSNFGRVMNVKKNKLVKQEIIHNGYVRVTLFNNGKPKWFFIHRLVAIAFIPNPHNYPQINHKDENKLNNCVDNLEWCTAKYNSNYGTRNIKISKPILQFDLDGNFIKEWSSTREIERILGFYHSNVSWCCTNKIKSAYNYIWKYKD